MIKEKIVGLEDKLKKRVRSKVRYSSDVKQIFTLSRSPPSLNSCVNTPRIDDLDRVNINVAPNHKKSTEGDLRAFSSKGENWIEFAAPIFTASEANGGVKRVVKRFGRTLYKAEHWTDKRKRHRQQKLIVALMLRTVRARDVIKMPCKITITRYAPRKLDRFDNLPMSVKYILDAICEVITGDYVPGRADSHEGLSVIYDQCMSKEYFVKVRIDNLV